MIKEIQIDQEAYKEYVVAMKAMISEEDRERMTQVRIYEKNKTMITNERDEYYRSHF